MYKNSVFRSKFICENMLRQRVFCRFFYLQREGSEASVASSSCHKDKKSEIKGTF